jgi:ERCC4-type nuclease
MHYKLVFDTRERAAIDEFNKLRMGGQYDDIPHEVRPLPIADFAVVETLPDGGEREVVLFERKSLEDLAASIKDGRYREQSMRMGASPVPNHNIVYIIEGSVAQYSRRSSRGVPVQTIYSGMCSVLLYKGLSVTRTMTVAETTMFILQCVKKMEREHKQGRRLYHSPDASQTGGGAGGSNCEGEGALVDPGTISVPEDAPHTHYHTDDVKNSYAYTVKKVKKENVRPDNIGEIVLSQIPGISSVSAAAIMSKCGSIRRLIDEMREDPTYLDDIRTITKAGVSRKLSAPIKRAVIAYLVDP